MMSAAQPHSVQQGLYGTSMLPNGQPIQQNQHLSESNSHHWQQQDDDAGSQHMTRGDHIPMAGPPKTWSEHDNDQGGEPRTVRDKALDSEMQLEELLRHIDALEDDLRTTKDSLNERMADDEVLQIQFRAGQTELELMKERIHNLEMKLSERNRQYEALDKKAAVQVVDN